MKNYVYPKIVALDALNSYANLVHTQLPVISQNYTLSDLTSLGF